MVLPAETNHHIIPNESREIPIDAINDKEVKQSITENGYINIVGSSGTVYFSKKTDDPLLGESDQLISGQSEDPMTTD